MARDDYDDGDIGMSLHEEWDEQDRYEREIALSEYIDEGE